jgi:toxin-antitoxin system PIN domain toxin
MIAFDTNLLVYAHRRDAPFHREAAAELRTAAEGAEPWAIPWPCVHEFLAIVTNPKIFRTATPLDQALDQVSEWMASPRLVLLGEERAGYWPILCRLAQVGRIRGAMIHDARVAALAILHGAEALWTSDRDFGRFGELRVRNPLQSGS